MRVHWAILGNEVAKGLANDLANPVFSAPRRGCSSMVEQKLPKLTTRVRFPSPAPAAPQKN